VSRSDNSAAYDEAVEALQKAQSAIRETNQEIEDKEQVIEQISIVRKWMARGRITLGVLGSLAVRTLVKIRDKAIDTALKMPIEYALTKLVDLAGALIKMWS